MNDILTNYESAEDFFTFGQNSIEIVEKIDEIEFLKSSYKLLCEDCVDKTELRNKAIKIYWTTRNFNDAINKYLKTAYFPLIRFIQTKLEELILEFEDEEKITMYENNKIEIKQEGGKGNKVKISKSQNKETNFVFQKESFWLGVLGAVISGLVVWGITELIKIIV